MSGFLRATYAIIADERACVAVFDGDSAGEKERKDLQQFFGRIEVPFQTNENFLSVRRGFAIEGLFPDEWIVQIHDEHSDWFVEYSIDVSGTLEPYRIQDTRKSNVQNILTERADAQPDLDWAARWVDFGNAAEHALTVLANRLARR